MQQQETGNSALGAWHGMALSLIFSAAMSAPSSATAQAQWARVAYEGASFTVTGSQQVRYGNNGSWVYKTVSGTQRCSNEVFGRDPLVGVGKVCEVNRASPGTPPPAPNPHAGHGPTINDALIPTGSAGIAEDRLYPTSERPAASDVGAFRTVCEFSHMAYDDPLVYPGQPGRSHLHVFFGNTGVNAHSTADSIAYSGNSTCRGGTVNRSAYWVPAMIDTREGRPLKPMDSNFYYKSGYYGVPPRNINAIPQGLRMIAGNAQNDGPQGPHRYKCVGDGVDPMYSQSIPNCPAGSELWLEIDFPQCWDGRNLDSADHKSHVAYANGSCPATHPVALPVITFNIRYMVTEAGAPLRWRLSSDMYDPSKPGGYSAHADWWNGWKPDIMDTWIRHCVQPGLDCHSHLLGDGRMM
ncbi:DUF1996 domain-containing protein [Caldimonas brevitalea]|uniref:DUF1996 domain-containing protein n=1 Tax=Caldimonas brevitalea TaxID=413882 RepID=A0A0G3BCW9_9BURK|nr:DUF1996 domain-containing protein [Caldimonas brevitalea]AKJ27182.1 hypothetical protein AAW51_0491 [Caldimonas brevitalea]